MLERADYSYRMEDLVNLVNAVNALRAQGHILAYHDRSDGGLFAAACEMAFAGQVGLALNVDLLVTEGDGISDYLDELRQRSPMRKTDS